DFAVRFLPDAPRVGRDGHVRVWAEVRSLNGFKGEVALTLTKAPPGVSAAPVTLAAGSSGVFTLRADPKAPLGTHAIQLQAVAVGGPDKVKRSAEAEHGGQVAAGAYLTVFQPAPFAVRPLGELSGEVLEAYKSQLADLEKKLHAPDPKLAAAQGGWEKKLGKSPSWVTLKLQDLSSRSGVRFTVAGDGSVRAGGPVNPDRETYTGFAQTDMKGIRAIRLEALADKKLPAGGPGRAPNGNFVLSTFSVTAAKAGDSSTAKPVAWQKVEADFSQANWAVAGAIDTNPKTGWAVSPKFGVNHAAVFRTAEPLGLDGGTRLAFTIDQPYGGQHTLGRFRISVTTDPNATLKKTPVGAVPADILAILRTPAGKRKAADAEKLSRHYRSIAPQLQPLRARMAQIRSIIGPALELQSLRQQLQRPDAKVEAAAAAWEKKLAAALSSNNPPAFGDWYHVGPFSGGDMNAVFNKAFGPEQKVDLKQKFAKGKLAWKAHPEWKDGVIHNPFTAANAANYIARTVTVGAPRKLALSLGSDDGIKVFLNGKPVLANNVGRGAAADQEKLTVDLVSGENRILIKVINGGGPSGFYFKAADKGVGVPPPVLAILKTPADKRDAKQKKALLAYYRETVDPELRKIREKIARIEKQVGGTFPPVGIRNQDVVLPVLLERRGDFSGPVKITVEGFSTGRDPKTGQPKAIAANIATKPVTLGAADSLAMLSLKPSAKSEVGARAVVLRAEAKVGAETWVQYSEAFDLTVKAK
ncbi:MAG: hypothetical protein OER86_03650, partial [Phycisphaerae bacterium]|nr:hypothetical protein [Phycisphaerae bacterium]